MTAPTECVFCAIIHREKSAYILYEDENFMAFLDHRPVFIGHTLLLPKKHFPTFFDLPQNMLEPMFALAQKVGIAIEKGLEANGIFMGNNNIVSQSVMHLHLHLIPRNFKDGLKGFFWPRHTVVPPEKMLHAQKRIQKYL